MNFKESYPPVDVAIAEVEIEIDRCKFGNIELIKVIHGHGASGIGGKIRIELRSKLQKLKKNKKIFDYIPGENFTQSRLRSMAVSDKIYNILITDEDYMSLNPGMTIIVIKNNI